MKQKIYITLFILCGLLFGFFLHMLFEIVIIDLLIRDYETYSFGLSWEQWFLVHGILAIVLQVAGIIVGFKIGKKFVHYFHY